MRIVILTYESLYSNLMTETLLKHYPGQVVGIVRSERLVHGKNLIESLIYLIKRTGLRFVGRKALELFQSRATAILFRLIGRPSKINSLRTIRSLYNVPVMGSTHVNSPQTLAQIQAWQPDIVISVYLNQLIKADLINLPPHGTLNIHPALLPRNRGLFPYFWVLSNQEKETGVTIHWVDEKFDTGDILLQEKLLVQPDDTITTLSYRSAALGAEMLVKAVQLIETEQPPHIPQNSAFASYNSWPNRADQRRFRQAGGRYGTIFELWNYM